MATESSRGPPPVSSSRPTTFSAQFASSHFDYSRSHTCQELIDEYSSVPLEFAQWIRSEYVGLPKHDPRGGGRFSGLILEARAIEHEILGLRQQYRSSSGDMTHITHVRNTLGLLAPSSNVPGLPMIKNVSVPVATCGFPKGKAQK